MHLKNPKAHNILHTRTDTHTDAPSASTYWKLIQLQASSETQHCCSCFGLQELIGSLELCVCSTAPPPGALYNHSKREMLWLSLLLN